MKKTETKVTKTPAKKAAESRKDVKPAVKTRTVKPKESKKTVIELPTMMTFPTVKKGDKGGYVTLLQTNLQNRGYYEGKVDGKFGEKTERAVMDFQKDLGKPLNGSVGPKTWESLQKSTMVKHMEAHSVPAPESELHVADIQPEQVYHASQQPILQGTRVLIEGLSRYQADLLIKLLSGHTECRIL